MLYRKALIVTFHNRGKFSTMQSLSLLKEIGSKDVAFSSPFPLFTTPHSQVLNYEFESMHDCEKRSSNTA